LAETGTPAGGTFTLTVSRDDGVGGSQTTGSIVYNATAGVVEDALEALSNVIPGDVEVTGSALPGATQHLEWAYNVTMTHTDSLTGGTSPAVVLTEVAD
jgi:hypothetical protein